jgi:hypothetical protein
MGHCLFLAASKTTVLKVVDLGPDSQSLGFGTDN